MFGISGTALGAILRAKGRDYKEISMVAAVYAIIVLLISIFVLFLTTLGLADLVTWLPENLVANLNSVTSMLIGSVLIGFGAFLSLILGAVVFDVAEAIIKGAKFR